MKLEQTVKELRSESNERARDDVDGDFAKKLEAKERDLAVVKKQAEGLAREYGELSDRYNNLLQKSSGDGTPKKDL